MKTFVKERPVQAGSRKKATVTVDDAAAFIANFENGALGTFEASRFARGRKNFNGFEIYGSKGSLVYNFEDMNRLQFFSAKDSPLSQGFRDILVTEPQHPYVKGWWPPGHIIGYQHTFAHAIYDFLNGLARGKSTAPDINEAVLVQAALEAVELSSKQRSWVRIKDLL